VSSKIIDDPLFLGPQELSDVIGNSFPVGQVYAMVRLKFPLLELGIELMKQGHDVTFAAG
jgi:hypothetical protein